MGDTIRYAIIGAGMMGNEHIRNIAIIDGAEVVAAADPHEGSRDWAKLSMEVARDLLVVRVHGNGIIPCQTYGIVTPHRPTP